MKQFWDQRYGEPGYAYGKEPNQFLKNSLSKLKPGKLLLPAEGEGRNAVYAAQNGWEVTAFDFSQKAQEKALKLAHEKNVEIDYKLTSIDKTDLSDNYFDVAALIFVHLPKPDFEIFLQKLLKSIKPGGQLIIEGYSINQLGRSSGGPKNENLLYHPEWLKNMLSNTRIELFEEREVDLSEGKFHKGPASVIRAISVII